MSQKLIMCKGLPGSGKSTWAAAQEGFTVVNKDDIRKSFVAKWQWSPKNEKGVIAIRDTMIVQALAAGNSVISSDTNLVAKHEIALRGLADDFGVEFKVEDFTGVPVETCISRDAARVEGKVGIDVILDMYFKYLFPRYEPNRMLPTAIICDLDGTLALHNGRSPYDFAKCGQDSVNRPVFDIIHAFKMRGWHIVYLSGRDDSAKGITREWLNRYGCPEGPLFMRRTGDKRNDALVKAELFDEGVRGVFDVRFVLDDRDRVVRMWRGIGLTCLQCAEGKF